MRCTLWGCHFGAWAEPSRRRLRLWSARSRSPERFTLVGDLGAVFRGRRRFVRPRRLPDAWNCSLNDVYLHCAGGESLLKLRKTSKPGKPSRPPGQPPGRAPAPLLGARLAFETATERLVAAEQGLKAEPDNSQGLVPWPRFISGNGVSTATASSIRGGRKLAPISFQVRPISPLPTGMRAICRKPGSPDRAWRCPLPIEICTRHGLISLHDPGQTAASLLEVHRQNRLALGRASGRRIPDLGNDPYPSRRLRARYLTGEFVANPAFCFDSHG